MDETNRYYEGIGRRKRSSARVRIYPAVKRPAPSPSMAKM
jgi:ribosomal protein S9